VGVVLVSDVVHSGENSDIDDPLCNYCGGRIEELDQQCPARDDGRCFP